jgi:ribosomal protein S18 acetylase RimI-like enzyme
MMADAQALVENLKAALRTFALKHLDGCTFEGAGILCVYSGMRSGVFNAVMLTERVESEAELRKKLEWINGEYQALDARWTIWLVEHFLPVGLRAIAPKILQKYGLVPQVRSPGMLAEALAPRRRPLPALDILPVYAPALRYDFCYVMGLAFKTKLQTFLNMYNTAEYWDGPLKGFIGYTNGRAAGTVCTLDYGGVVGLYGVCTHPELQRRGIGERMLRYALEEARRESGQAKPMVLESSLEAVGLYANLGFEQVTTVTIYGEPK